LFLIIREGPNQRDDSDASGFRPEIGIKLVKRKEEDYCGRGLRRGLPEDNAL
jgi:hypothetical protein